MSGYNMESFISDFAERTKANLEVISLLASNNYHDDPDDHGKRVFEVTQRINSLLGLVIFPHEKFKKLKSGEIAMNGYMEDAAKKIQDLLNNCKKLNKPRYFNNFEDASNPEDTSNPEVTPNHEFVFDFCKHLRNSIAHRGIHISPVEEGVKIRYVIFYDSDYYVNNNNKHEFCLKLTVKQVADLAGYIADFYINIEKDQQNQDYKRWIKKLDWLLQHGQTTRQTPTKVTVAEQLAPRRKRRH